MTTPTVIFDLDGTLVDTAPDLVTTLNTILARAGLPPVDYSAARNMVGGGARAMLERGLAAESCSPPKAEVDRMVKEFILHYSTHIADASKPFEGVEAALDALASRGFRLAVCTNKLEALSVRLLRLLGLSRRFSAICGADTFGVAKPDPRILLNTLARAGGSSQYAVMIGDSITDIATARAAGVPVIAVDFGYSEMPVSQLAPDRVASRFAELPQFVSELLAARQTESAREA
jgi:phosphoglycolate phosphatase